MDNSYDPSGRLKMNFIRQQTMDEGSLISARTKPVQKLSEYFKFLRKNSSGRQHSDDLTFIKNFDNSSTKSHDSSYMNKIFQLLKKKDKNYSLKRKNIEKTTYNFDENNNLYLTLPKFDYGKRIREQINDRKKLKDESTINKSRVIVENSMDNSRHNLEDLIPEFFQNNNTKSDESEADFKMEGQESDSLNSSLNEDEKNALFEKLKTRNKFISDTNPLKKRFKNEKESFNHLNHLNHFKNSHSISDSKLLRGNFPVFTSQNKNILRPKIQSTKSLLENDELFKNFKIMKEKMAIIKNNKKKKKTVIAADIFYYDKKKWEIQRIKESDRIVRRLEEVEHKRKDWNDKHIPDLNLPIVPLSELRNELKRNSINRKFTKGSSILFSNRDILDDEENLVGYDVKEVTRLSLPHIIPQLQRMSMATK